MNRKITFYLNILSFFWIAAILYFHEDGKINSIILILGGFLVLAYLSQFLRKDKE